MKNKIIVSLFFSLSFVWSSMAQTATISGRISAINDDPLATVTVNISGGDFSTTTTTSADGVYIFENVPTGTTYTIQPVVINEVIPLIGVTTFDMVMILREINKSLDTEIIFSPVAADVNEDGRISVLDVWVIRQQILGVVDFPGLAQWKFIPADFGYYDSPSDVPTTISLNLMSSQENVDFLGVKLGDASGNAKIE